jgi:c-di-GMP-binding flagellar brake protein YcgR
MPEPKREERRRFVRVEMTVPVKYRTFRNSSEFQSSFNVGRSKDISVGGLKCAVSKHNPIETKLDIEIELSDTLSAYVVGKVLGGEDRVIDGIVHRFDRVTFLQMEPDVQELLMRQVFEQMRRNRGR